MYLTLHNILDRPAWAPLLVALKSDKVLAGTAVCITGTLSINRTSAEALLTDFGARVVGDATRSDMLVVGTSVRGEMSRKVIDAHHAHVEQVNEQQLIDTLLCGSMAKHVYAAVSFAAAPPARVAVPDDADDVLPVIPPLVSMY
jgi:hypothetical protein